MELRHLKYFVAVAEEQSFRLAAIRLHLSQPPLSRQIQQLEEEVNAVLLTRTSTGVVLTESGIAFLEEARKILSFAREAVEKVGRIERGEEGHLNIGYYGSVIFKVLPQILVNLRSERSRISTSLKSMRKDQQIWALRRGLIDVGFGRSYRHEPDIDRHLVLDEPLFAAVPAEHELAHRKTVALRQLRDCAFVMYPGSPRPGFADEVMMLCDQAGFKAHVVDEADDVHACLALVSARTGIAVVPASAVSQHDARVRFVRLVNPTLTSSLWCVTRSGDKRPAVNALLQMIRSSVSTEAAVLAAAESDVPPSAVTLKNRESAYHHSRDT